MTFVFFAFLVPVFQRLFVAILYRILPDELR